MKRSIISLLILIIVIPMMSQARSPVCTDYVSNKICQQIGQMVMVGFGGYYLNKAGEVVLDDPHGTVFDTKSLIAQDIIKYHVGGVILFARPIRDGQSEDFFRYRNVQGPAQLAKLTHDLQQFSRITRAIQQLPSLSLLIAIDQEGGMIDRLPSYQGFHLQRITPQALGVKQQAAGQNESQKLAALQTAQAFAEQLAANLDRFHINVDLAPVVDVNINPTSPAIGALGRSYSDDPRIVVDQASEVIKALHKHGILATLKHFPGHGSATGDSHAGMTDVTRTYDRNRELLPYRDLIKSGFDDLIMTTHVINGQLDHSQCKPGKADDPATWCPGTMSQATLTTLLRNELGFRGVIISDDMTMGAIKKEYDLPVALSKAIHAGVDMFIVTNGEAHQTPEVILTIAKLVKQGDISQDRIAASYHRIVKLKQKLPLTRS